MFMKRIEVTNLTKDYGRGKGVFGLNLAVEQGQVAGLLGPNGAGKTTLVRHLMGFIRPDEGEATIDGRDCFHDRAVIQKTLGYIPGEVALVDEMTGLEFLHFMADMKKLRDRGRMMELMDYFELDPRGKIRKMSKGMKQKIGIICAFMGSPEILLLDEPTSGLDPLMQNRFIELIGEEKQRGATILLSSHIFEEVEKACDHVFFIKEGRLAADSSMEDVRKNKLRTFQIRFGTGQEQSDFLRSCPEAKMSRGLVEIPIVGRVDSMMKQLSAYSIADIHIKEPTLEDMFLRYYGEGKK